MILPELPGNWARAHLSEIVLVNPKSLGYNPSEDELVSFVPMASVQEESGVLDPSTLRPWKEVSKGYTRFQENDVLFAKITPCMENGKYAVAKGLRGGLAAGSTEFHVLRPTTAINSKFLLYFLFQPELRHAARLSMRGAAGQLRVPADFFEVLEINLPPRLEQDRIVAEIEKQFTRLDDAIAALKRVQTNLKHYRASVLKAACEGRLVPTEAALASNEIRHYESASELLKPILIERRAKWESDQQKIARISKKLGSNRSTKRYPEPANPYLAGLPALPNGWVWASLDMVCSKVQDGTHFSPKLQFDNGPFKYITAKNIKLWGLDLTELTYIDELTHQEIYGRCNPEFQDVLYIKDGVTTGIAIVNPLHEQFSLLSSVALLKPLRNIIDPQFMAHYLNSPDGFHSMTGRMTGTAIKRLILERIREAPIPVPPLEEQTRIVAEVNRRFSVDAPHQSLETLFKKCVFLRRTILRQAFAGRLVTQNFKDEPASALLERIRRERPVQLVMDYNKMPQEYEAMLKKPAGRVLRPRSVTRSKKAGAP